MGFILAAAGSAVGLGNIWRFPYLAAKYGGGMFLLVYLILAVTFGFSLMVTEIAIGRKTGKSPLYAYGALNKRFKLLGLLSSAVPIIIFPYYCVIGGWVTKYLTVYIAGQGADAAVSTIKDAQGNVTTLGYFDGFISDTWTPLIFFAIFIILTAVVVMLGVQNGIERISKIMMPVLIVLSIGLSIYSLTLPGAMDGFLYYITPNFENFSFETVIAAMGQLFYSMSLAMGIMITYGSYMRKDDNIEKSTRHIEIFDTGIAFLAGMMIIPAVFAFQGGDRSALNAGPSLMFVTLPKVFNSFPGGNILGFAFFLLVLFAALTSAISLMETIVSIVMEKTGWGRIKVSIIVLIMAVIIGVPSSLGFGVLSGITPLGKDILSFFDYISNNIMMPIVALLTAILVGFVVKPQAIIDEVEQNGQKFKVKKLYIVMIKFIVPVCMLLILIAPFFGLGQ